MTTTRLAVQIPDTTLHGDRINVFGNFGSVISSPLKLTGHSADARQGKNRKHRPSNRGWGSVPLGESTWSGSPAAGGWAEGRFFEGSMETPIKDRLIDVDTPVGFGRFTFTVQPVDPHGNPASATAEVTRTIVEPPRGVGSVAFSAYDSGPDVLTLSVTHLTEGT